MRTISIESFKPLLDVEFELGKVNVARGRLPEAAFPSLPNQAVLCVPSTASETWAFVASLTEHEANVPREPVPDEGQCIEWRTDIKSLSRERSKDIGGKLVTQKQGTPRNHAPAYREIQERITHGWKKVVASCNEAPRLDGELQAAKTCVRS